MIQTIVFRTHIPKKIADDLNQESARHYTNVMKWHWRIYRKHGIWLSQSAAEKLEDYIGQAACTLTAGMLLSKPSTKPVRPP